MTTRNQYDGQSIILEIITNIVVEAVSDLVHQTSLVHHSSGNIITVTHKEKYHHQKRII